MTRRVVTETGDTSVSEAAATMSAAGLHHLVILDGDRIDGILSATDVARAAADSDLPESVSQIMSADLVELDCGETIADALGALKKHDVTAAVVRDQGAYLGVVSQLTLLTSPSREERLDQVIREAVATVQLNASIARAASILSEAGQGRLLVLNQDGRVCGLVSASDFIYYSASLQAPVSSDDFDGETRASVHEAAATLEQLKDSESPVGSE